jgi:hypothetical protein
MKEIDISFKNNFPGLMPKRHGVRNRLYNFKILRTQPAGRPKDIISTIIVALGIASAATMTTTGVGLTIFGLTMGLTWSGITSIIVAAATIGLTVWSMVGSGGQKGMAGGGGGALGQIGGAKAIDQNGQLVNTRQAAKVLPIIYGIARVGGNWIFGRPSSDNVNILNAVLTWSEGQIEGLATAIDYTPLFSGSGPNDLHTGGEFSPTDTCTCDGPCYDYSACSCNMTCDAVYA